MREQIKERGERKGRDDELCRTIGGETGLQGLTEKQCDKQADPSAAQRCRLTGITEAGLIQLQQCLNPALPPPSLH